MPAVYDSKSVFLVGIKGVAMTSIAQCLVDMGKKVSGSDLAEDFVTQKILEELNLVTTVGFESELPAEIDLVIYTSAHGGPDNPQVKHAVDRGLVVISQAEALAELFNTKKGIAVSGVGGKSTTAAMITWILSKKGLNPSFSIGVGNISGLDRTGKWVENSEYFVAEADEYVIDPQAVEKGEQIIPRFSFLEPFITVCTNLAFDHPDVYQDFKHTKQIFNQFFSNQKAGGQFVYNIVNKNDLPEIVTTQGTSFGESSEADLQFKYHPEQSKEGTSIAEIKYQENVYRLELSVPGKFNIQNAAAALAATAKLGLPVDESILILKDFHSTMRRFEFIGEKKGIKYYDDYAHHPSEVKAAIQALDDWYPDSKKIICFQSHTFSRTKEFLNDFVTALATADEVILIDIFPSAREAFDPSISSDMIVDLVKQVRSNINISNVKTIDNLASLIKESAEVGNVVLTLGAGDIYKVHEKIA